MLVDTAAPMALQVDGPAYACNLVVFDHDSQRPRNIDELYVRTLGVSIRADQIIPGPFAQGPYTFPVSLGVGAPAGVPSQGGAALRVGGDALVGAFVRLFGAEDTQGLRIGLYALLGIIVIVVVVYGYQFMLLVNRVAVWANTVLMLLAVIAFSGTFDANFAGSGEYLLGDFWPTFLLAALIAMSNPISFGAFLGDWARYIPRGTSNSKLMLATLGAQTMTLIPFIFGVATMTLVTGGDYVVGLIGAAPEWYAYLIIVVAFVGGLSTGTTSLYGTGLDFSSVFPKLSRVQATIAIGAVAFAFIVAGRLFVDLLGAVNGFVGAIVVTTTPWMIIMAIGYWNRRGWYSTDDLQVFNKGKQGGRYWFNNGINWRAMVAWIVSAVLGLQFAYYPPIIEGQWSGVAGGIDLSLIVAIVSAAVLYVGALLIFPEPDYAFGPEGPRIGRATKSTIPPVR